jgi:hypothetical protein
MRDVACRMLTLMCLVIAPLPIGTNLSLLHLLRMVVSGRPTAARSAVFGGLSDYGLPDRAAAVAAGKALPVEAAIAGALGASWRVEVENTTPRTDVDR